MADVVGIVHSRGAEHIRGAYNFLRLQINAFAKQI